MGDRQPFTATLAIWGLLLAIGALAQGIPAPAPGASPSLQDAILLRSKTLFEYRVKSPQGEDLGKIEEVMIDMEMGRVAYAVLSFGGLWGLGSKWVPVPWDAVALQTAEKALLLKIEKEKIEKAPNFEAATLPELANRQWGPSSIRITGNLPIGRSGHDMGRKVQIRAAGTSHPEAWERAAGRQAFNSRWCGQRRYGCAWSQWPRPGSSPAGGW
jgi:sporulation protein YlmC with PRC-barrel domain